MPYTSLLGLSLPTTGTLAGTWGDEVNNAITSLLDTAVAGTTTISTDADVTLTTTDGVANQARSAVILWTAGGTVTRNITAPARSKAYVVINATSSSQSIVIRGTGPTTGVTVAAGKKSLVAWNGTDFVAVAGGQINLASDVTGTLAATNGGTSQSTYATGDVLYASAANTLSKLTVGATGTVLTVAGGVPTWASAATGIPSQTGNAGKYLTTDGTNPSWTNTGASAGGSIYINNTTISQNYTIASGQNGQSVGPITVSSGFSVTVSSGQRWVVL